MENPKADKALNYYEKHLNRVKQYNETHREQIRNSLKQSYHRMKEDPERWEAFKAKKRAYYQAKQQKNKEKIEN
jgi:hypothetical protein